MSKGDILRWFTGNAQTLSVEKILVVLCVCLLLGAIVFFTYKLTYSGISYSDRFNSNNIIIMLLTAIIMLMIGSNIAISLGMVGALSIVRFRTAIKDPQDTIYIFWSIVEGLCVGAQIYQLAVVSTLFVAIVLIAMYYYAGTNKKYLVIIRGDVDLNKDAVLSNLKLSFKNPQIASVNDRENSIEIIARIKVKGEISIDALDSLKALDKVKSANWVLEGNSNL